MAVPEAGGVGPTSTTHNTHAPAAAGKEASANTKSSPIIQACKCLNIQLNVPKGPTKEAIVSVSEGVQGPAHLLPVDQDAIRVVYPCFLSRETITIQEQVCAALRCHHCGTTVYAVRKVAHAAAQRTVGFQVLSDSTCSLAPGPSENVGDTSVRTVASTSSASVSPARNSSAGSAGGSGSREREGKEQASTSLILQPADGHVWLLPGTLEPRAVEAAKKSPLFSPIYGICLAPSSKDELPKAKTEALKDTVEEDGEDEKEQLGRGRSLLSKLSTSRQPGSVGAFPATSLSAPTSAAILPPVPRSLLASPPASPISSAVPPPGFPSSLSARYKSPTRVASRSTTPSRYDPDVLYQLEGAALARLKQARADADREVQALIRKHSQALQSLQEQAERQGKVLLSESQSGPSSQLSFQNAPWVSGQIREHTPAASPADQQRLLSVPRSASRASSGESKVEGSETHDSSSSTATAEQGSEELPPPAFQRRKPSTTTRPAFINRNGVSGNAASGVAIGANTSSAGGSGSTGPGLSSSSQAYMSNLSSSLSALSASFAMRGREPPPQPPVISSEDWAAKKRLRERYPEGDHSAMNSEVNSLVNSEENSDAEEEERGRGRTSATTAPGAVAPTANEAQGRGRDRDTRALRDSDGARGRGTREAPSLGVVSQQFAPGSLKIGSKTEPSIAAVSSETTGAATSGATASSLSTAADSSKKEKGEKRDHTSGEILLKPRGPPPSSAEPLKPATRRSKTSTNGGDVRGTPSRRKSVAFAETTENVQGLTLDEQERLAGAEEDSSAPELLDETDNAVFDIDEDVEPEQVRPEDPNVDSKAVEVLIDRGSPDADGGADEETFGGKASTISASLSAGGSLSALAAAELHQEAPAQNWNDPNFDPSSLRIEDVYAKHGISESMRRAGLTSSSVRPPAAPLREMERGGIRAQSKLTIGDAEAQLSGLLAPHAPSHRQLWNKEQGKRVRKYALNDEDDEKWAAWKDRVRAKEAEAQRRALEDASSSSVPSGDTPPAGSLAIRMTSGVGYSSIVHDGSSGFDREPKTSLPYNERMMVPSLKKATRRAQLDRPPTMIAPTLPTIKDEGDAESKSQEAFVPTTALATAAAVRTAQIASHAESHSKGELLPGSVSQRGFVLGPSHQPTAQGAHLAPGADPQGSSKEASSILTPPPAIVAGIQAPIAGRVSPRPPYVRPAQPTSSNIVLQPDPREVPAPLMLFDVEPDSSFKKFEEAEKGNAGDISKTLEFMHRLQMLKLNKRTGWLHHRATKPESIADHMYRMALLAMLCPADDVDIGKCVLLALIHDLAEAEVGDLTPLDGVSKEEKVRREREAIEHLVHDLLESSPAGLRIEKLWHEYEDRQTKESKLVKDLDRFELCLQAVEYERQDNILDLQPFFRSSINQISHPRQRLWAKQLALERQAMWAERGRGYAQTFISADVK